MKPFKILYVDDEKLQHQQISKMINELNEPIEIHFYSSGNEFFFHWQDHLDAKVIILDVEMPGMNGLEIAKKIRETNQKIPLVFITAYGQYAIKGYEVMALSYLLKPVTVQQLQELITKVRLISTQTDKSIIIEFKNQKVRLAEKEIYAIEALGRNSILYFKDKKEEVNLSFSEVCSLLSLDFIQTHRSFMANINHVHQLQKESILLDNKISIPLSRRLYKEVMDAFVRQYQKEGYSL